MSAYYQGHGVTLYHGDALDVAGSLPAGSVRTIVTSPPYYGLRDYGEDGQIGAEGSVGEYVARMVALFGELRRVLADDGTLWLNLGDSYAGAGGSSAPSANSTLRGNGHVGGGPKLHHVPDARRPRTSGFSSKNLLGVPWRVAFALQDAGWILRSDVIWAKPNPMPESVTDRPTKAHEYLFLLAKSPRYYYDADAIAEDANPESEARYKARFGGAKSEAFKAESELGRTRPVGDREFTGKRNKRTFWEIATVPFPGSHFAVYPPELIRPCIRAGSAVGDTVLDPFSGSGTTGMVARQEGRNYIGIDLNREYLDLSLRTRFEQPVLNIWAGAP